MSLDASRRAPQKEVGRQSWLRERLAKEKGIDVSPNSVHKWVNGSSRPREDNIRAIAEILEVDEIWLSLGRMPTAGLSKKSDAQSEGSATGVSPGALILAGLLQRAGGNVVFADKDDAASLYANTGSGSTGVIVVECEEREGSLVAVIPEPVANNRIATVLLDDSSRVGVYDLTDKPRQNFGGYSIMSLTRREDGRLEIDGSAVSPTRSVRELA